MLNYLRGLRWHYLWLGRLELHSLLYECLVLQWNLYRLRSNSLYLRLNNIRSLNYRRCNNGLFPLFFNLLLSFFNLLLALLGCTALFLIVLTFLLFFSFYLLYEVFHYAFFNHLLFPYFSKIC